MRKNKNNANRQSKPDRMSTQELNGIYKGVVKDVEDRFRTGRMTVHIESLGEDTEGSPTWKGCYWTSPFAGSTDTTKISNTELTQYEKTQKSYGMWMVPPDVGNQVLVAFGDSFGKYGYIIACLFSDTKNYMVPGMAAGLNYGDPNLRMPVAEKNPFDERRTKNDVERPVHVDFAEAIVKQGLINDPLRGAGTASARREEISQVFGILTPGPRDRDISKSKNDNYVHRTGGHQFIMDDNYDSRMIRLRTAGGNQIMMDDTTGTIYMINKKGTAWTELAVDGTINVFAEGSINYRAKGNFNLRADKNVNIEAGQNVNIKAAGNNRDGQTTSIPALGALGVPPLGTGGKVTIEAASDLDMFAALNSKLTATGGDIDINSGNRIAATASGPLGITMGTSEGPIAINAAGSLTGVGTAGVHWIGTNGVALTGSQVLLNSGGVPPVPSIPAVSASQIGTNSLSDYASEPPGFDRDSARRGGSGATTNGDRRKAIPVDTIVPVMTTAEPYSGHGQYDSSDLFGVPVSFGESVADNLPLGASNFSGTPDDVVSPGNAFQQGANYVDSVGGNVIGQGVGAAQDLLGGLPTYNEIGSIATQFSAAQGLLLTEIQGIGSLIAGLRSSVPPIRFPTSNALAQKAIGIGKMLTEQAAQLQQFALDAQALALDLESQAIAAMRDKIAGAVSAVAGAGAAALTEKLAAQGIKVIPDGPGTIFEDAVGNRIVDFSNGIGPIGTTLGAVSDLTTAFEDVKGAIQVPVSANQALAISSFAQSIGADNFKNSNVLNALNDGKYSEIPRLMQGWSVAATRPGEQGTVQQELQDRRSWEGEIFQTPDGVDFSAQNFAEGESSFRQQAENISIARDQFVASKS